MIIVISSLGVDTHIYTCAHTHIHAHTRLHTCTHTHAHTCTHTHTHTHMYVYIHAHIPTFQTKEARGMPAFSWHTPGLTTP